ncbi:tailspike protein [Vibrio phage 1.061.O._10N.286.55.C2]|nr:tailspike protein [Vibrio phage 1.061.O._10N.286.55.C2]
MSSNLIKQPYEMILDPTGGGGRAKPVANGKFYVGEIDKDPIANPRTDIAYKDESGQERPLTSPLTLNNSGAFVVSKNDGTIIQPYMKNAVGFSVLIQDARGRDVYSGLNTGDPGNLESAIVEFLPDYTDIVYKASGGNSAFDNMIAEFPIAIEINQKCQCENGTVFLKVSETGTDKDFEPVGAINLCDFGLKGDYQLFDRTVNPSATDNKNNIQVAFDFAIDDRYSRGDSKFYKPYKYLLPFSYGGYGFSGGVILPENCDIDFGGNDIHAIGNPNNVFELNLRTERAGRPAGYYYRSHTQNFKFYNFFVGSTRTFGDKEPTPDFGHMINIEGGWIIRSGFYDIGCRPGASLKSIINLDLTHPDPDNYEVGVPDEVDMHRISAQYAQNASYTITINGDGKYGIGTGSRTGKIDFRAIYTGSSNGYDYLNRSNSTNDFGVIRAHAVLLAECNFDFIFGIEHLLNAPYATASNTEYRSCKFPYLNVEKNQDSGTGRGAMLFGEALYNQCDFGNISPYTEVNKLSRDPQCIDINASNCTFNRLVMLDLNHGSNPLPSDYFRLRPSSKLNRFKEEPTSRTVNTTNRAFIMQQFTVPIGTRFDYLENIKTFDSFSDDDISTLDSFEITKIDGNNMDVSTKIEVEGSFVAYVGSSATIELRMKFNNGSDSLLETIALTPGNNAVFKTVIIPKFKTPVWNDFSNQFYTTTTVQTSDPGYTGSVGQKILNLDSSGDLIIYAKITASTGGDVIFGGAFGKLSYMKNYINNY